MIEATVVAYVDWRDNGSHGGALHQIFWTFGHRFFVL
jgi:hypothetical protein